MYSFLRTALIPFFFAVATNFAVLSPAASAPSTALSFDGNSWVEVPDRSDQGNTSLDIAGPLTMEAWINFTTYPNCCWNTVMAKLFGTSGENGSYGIEYSNHPSNPVSSDTLWAFFVSGVIGHEGGVRDIDASPIRNGNWHHIAAVYDIEKGKTRVFIDGELAGENDKTAPLQITDSIFTIGNQLGAERRTFQGLIDEVRLWNVARTQSEIRNYMSREVCPGEPGLAGYWNFNEGSGNTAHDRSGNENHGTFVNSPVWVSSGPDLAPCPVVRTVQIGGPWFDDGTGNLVAFDVNGDALIDNGDEGALIGIGLPHAQFFAYRIEIANDGLDNVLDSYTFLDALQDGFALSAYAENAVVGCVDAACDGVVADNSGKCLVAVSGPSHKKKTIPPRFLTIKPSGLAFATSCTTTVYVETTSGGSQKGNNETEFEPSSCEIAATDGGGALHNSIALNEGLKMFNSSDNKLLWGPRRSIQLEPQGCP